MAWVKQVGDWLVYVVVRALIAVVQALPIETCDRICRQLALVAHDIVRIRRRVVNENLQLAFPHLTNAERSQIARRMWHHLLLMVCEIAHAPRKLHPENWKEHMVIPQVERAVRMMLTERPLVLISGHFGNFELGGFLLGLFGFPTYSIARPLDNRFLHRFVTRFRGMTGQHMIPKEGSRETIAELLRENRALALLGDQAAGNKACWVEFFGRPASTHKAVAVLSLGAEAPLAVVYNRRVGRPLQYELEIEGVADPAAADFSLGSVPQMAQWYTDCLERIICRSPEQYWWLHRRWKGKPPKSALRRIERTRKAKAA